MDYPVPNHLKEIYIVDEEKSDMYGGLEGTLKCQCGCGEFALEIYAEVFDKYISVNKKDGGFAFVVDAVCKSCGRRHTIMDLSKHGYDGFVCEDGLPVCVEELKPCGCAKCGANRFKLDVGIEVEDREQFIEECVEFEPERFVPEDYVDAFNWIVISTKCAECGDYRERWVDLELS